VLIPLAASGTVTLSTTEVERGKNMSMGGGMGNMGGTGNSNSMMDHPFHLHVWPFQVIGRSGGGTLDPGWHDTVNIPVGKSVTIRIPFADFGGKTVFHCHILGHEDLGMMANINVSQSRVVNSPGRLPRRRR
jgi:hypothetical protein